MFTVLVPIEHTPKNVRNISVVDPWNRGSPQITKDDH